MKKANEVIESYVLEVIQQLPKAQRQDIGLELRGLLTEMWTERQQPGASAAELDAQLLALLREFGTPAEVAARYRPPGNPIIPAEQTRSFAILALGGLGLQWALSLPQVSDGRSLTAWWLSWGIGAFWWPGFMVVMALIAAGLRQLGWFQRAWTPRSVDPERVQRGVLGFGLLCQMLGAALVLSLPWLTPRLPGMLPQVLALDPAFVAERAWPLPLLWAASFALYAWVIVQGRWSHAARRLETASSLGFVILLGWWLQGGTIFSAPATEKGARAALALVLLITIASLAYQLYRQRVRLPAAA